MANPAIKSMDGVIHGRTHDGATSAQSSLGSRQAAHSDSCQPVGIFLDLSNISKTFGSTPANQSVSLSVRHGEIIGLVGANGAGKSTFIQILSGLLRPDGGTLTIAGNASDFRDYDRAVAQEAGIRTVFQELSLCLNLTVPDNFLIKLAGQARGARWRRAMRTRAAGAIAKVFPSAGIDLDSEVGSLSIAERQMIEIARAASDPAARLIVLDEPTSSLDAHHSEELHSYLTGRVRDGVSFIFVSHKLQEILRSASRVVVMRNGTIVWAGETRSTSIGHLVELMGGDHAAAAKSRLGRAAAGGGAHALVEILSGAGFNRMRGDIGLRRGEIVGLAGLDGNGQKRLLHRLHACRRGRRADGIRVNGRASFVSGDRAHEGIFPDLSLVWNAVATRVAERGLLSSVSERVERQVAAPLLEVLGVPNHRLDEPIIRFSGGSQQKALMARPLLATADLVLLDDPTRGVDIGAKRQIYRLIRQAADSGKLVVWYSSEDVELLECDRVLVMHDGSVVEELDAASVSANRIVDSAFSAQTVEIKAREVRRRRRLEPASWSRLLPMVSLIAAYAVIVYLNPTAATVFGVDLLLGGAVPLVLASLSQMFIVGGSQIDLGLGPFTALVSVVAATLLVTSPPLGVLVIAGCLAGYVAVGALIELTRMSSLVVTLGASFVWIGIGHLIQEIPGGSTPGWLAALSSLGDWGVPAPIVWILVGGLAAFAINRSRSGIIMRGFGDNPKALRQSGWSPARVQVGRYGIAAAFACAAGLAMTAANGGADINSGNTLTLLSVAAVVIGGCSLVGGRVTALGTVGGALTLALIGTLLGSFGISGVFSASVQGTLLIGVLLLRSLAPGRN